MTNAEKFAEVFGIDLKRQYITRPWWDQEFVSVGKQEPFMNKPCVANQVCNEDKVKALDEIREEIKALTDGAEPERIWNVDVFKIIDTYKDKAESEEIL